MWLALPYDGPRSRGRQWSWSREVACVETQQVVLAPTPQVAQSIQWVFTDKSKKNAVVVAPDFIVLETTRYQDFETFSKSLHDVLNIVLDVTKVSLAERLGLRYIDLIRQHPEEGFRRYVNPGLVGIHEGQLPVKKSLQRFESTSNTDLGTLIIKLAENDNGAVLPPDLQSGQLTLDAIVEPGEKITLLDLDHFTQETRDFIPDDSMNTMWELHDVTDRAFRAAVTKDALSEWKEPPE